MRDNPASPHSTEAGHLPGIELMRGLAAFGVIGIHAGLVVHNQVSAAATTMQGFFGFAVPFFLMTAFFFAIRGEKTMAPSWGEWWRIRFARLLVPFVVWSVIYLTLRVAKFYFEHESEQAKELFLDPVSLLLSGGSSVALYFIPILFTGLVVVHLLRQFLNNAPAWVLVAALLIAAVGEWFLEQTGNQYGNGVAFAAMFPGLNEIWPIRLLLAIVAHAIRCFPLIFAACLAVRYLPEPGTGRSWLVLAAGMILFVVASYDHGKSGFHCSPELEYGAATFLLGWGLSGLLAPNRFITMLGTFSFGVYLVHQVVLEGMQMMVQWLSHGQMPLVRAVFILIISVIAYAISMLMVGLASYGGVWLRRIFGLR